MIDEQFLQTIPQYGIGGFVGKFFKKVKKVVKKVAPIVGGGIGFMIGGAAGAGIGAGIGGLVAGQSADEALQTAMLGYGIGSLAGVTPGLKGFGGKGIGGKMAWNPTDKGNLFNMFKGSDKVAAIDDKIAALKNSPLAGTSEGATALQNLTNAKNQLAVNEILGVGKTLGGSGLSNTLLAGSLALPVLSYMDAKAAQDNWEPGDPSALNPLYYTDPQAYQIAGQGVDPYYFEDLQEQFGVPIADLPTDFVRSAKGGMIQKYNDGGWSGMPHQGDNGIDGPYWNEDKVPKETHTLSPDVPYDDMQKDQMMGYLMMKFEENPSAFEQQYGNEMAEFFRNQLGYKSKEQYSKDTGAIFDKNSSEIIGYNLAQGGIIQLADGSEKYFPRKNGEIDGPGTGTSDDIPAMLSDGEFVFTAKAVNNAGGGNRREGAKRMYQVMKNLENNGTLSNQSRGIA
mgnify:CR=1 FL=1